MANYAHCSHIKVRLSDVLETIYELEEAITKGLLREEASATEESLKQTLGKIQGLHTARRKLELAYMPESEEPYG